MINNSVKNILDTLKSQKFATIKENEIKLQRLSQGLELSQIDIVSLNRQLPVLHKKLSRAKLDTKQLPQESTLTEEPKKLMKDPQVRALSMEGALSNRKLDAQKYKYLVNKNLQRKFLSPKALANTKQVQTNDGRTQ